MAAFPARDERRFEAERRDEVPSQGEMSPQLKRALQVANAARARAARIRAEGRARYGEIGRPPPHLPEAPRIIPTPPCATSSGHVTLPESMEAARPKPAATASAPADKPADVEPAAPVTSGSKRAGAPSAPAAEAPSAPPQPRFARTRAAIQSERLSGWAIELKEATPPEPTKARLRLGAAVASGPTAEAAKLSQLPEGLGQISPEWSRRAPPTKSQIWGKEPPADRSALGSIHQDPPLGPSAASRSHARAPQSTATPASETAPGPTQPAGRTTSRTWASVRAAYRSVRNSIAFALGIVIGAVLLAGLRSEGALDVVRSIWSMKPPRVVTVERVLTLDLPPFEEVIEMRDPLEVRAADTTPPSAPGGGEDGIALDLLKRAGGDDPRIADLTAIVRRDPSRWDAFYNLGHAMQDRGDLEAAERLYRRAVSLNPRHAAMAYDLGYALQRQGDFQGAVEQYRAAIALQPDHAYALYNLGVLLRRQGAYAEAADIFERASGIQTDNPDLYYEWARTVEAGGQPGKAIDLYRHAAALSPDRWPGPDARARMQTLMNEARQAAAPRS